MAISNKGSLLYCRHALQGYISKNRNNLCMEVILRGCTWTTFWNKTTVQGKKKNSPVDGWETYRETGNNHRRTKFIPVAAPAYLHTNAPKQNPTTMIRNKIKVAKRDSTTLNHRRNHPTPRRRCRRRRHRRPLNPRKQFYSLKLLQPHLSQPDHEILA